MNNDKRKTARDTFPIKRLSHPILSSPLLSSTAHEPRFRVWRTTALKYTTSNDKGTGESCFKNRKPHRGRKRIRQEKPSLPWGCWPFEQPGAKKEKGKREKDGIGNGVEEREGKRSDAMRFNRPEETASRRHTASTSIWEWCTCTRKGERVSGGVVAYIHG